MGYQLWTSPITGYRRKGTRLSELRSVLGIGITARTILEPLQSCVWNAPAQEMASVLRERGFDVAGVQASEKGPVSGFVMAHALGDGTVEDHTEPLRAEHLVSDATPLGDLLSLLRSKERVFVLVGADVKGIITLADLNKPSVRVYLFGLISLLEMHLRFWVLASYGPDGWEKEVKEERLLAANELQEERRGRNEEIALLDCLQFCDKRDLVVAKTDLRTKLGLGSKGTAASLLRKAEDLRNRLAHSQQDLVQGTSWPVLIEVIESLEAMVHRSDDAVEEMAKTSGKGINRLLVVM
jgi:hypothetical protein